MPMDSFFSTQNMSKAIAQLAPFLSPTPSYQDKESFDYTKYSIVDDNKEIHAKFKEEIVMNGAILSFEMILLVVECIKRSSDALKKSLFCLNKKTQSSPGKFIFVKWLSYAINRIEEKQKDGDILAAGDSQKEDMIAVSIMELICSFSVIKNKKQLELLKFLIQNSHDCTRLQIFDVFPNTRMGLFSQIPPFHYVATTTMVDPIT